MAKILLIEPDRVLAGNIREYLEGVLKHHVQWRSDAQAAINSSEEFPPEVVIMEIQLGLHSGVEFLYEFRSYPEWQKIPVIILSSLPDTEVSSHTIYFDDLEIVAYHYKPHTTLEHLGETIQKALDLRQ